MKKIKPKSVFFTYAGYILLKLLLVALSFSCASKKNLNNVETVVEANPKLVFLNYTISEDDNGKKSIEYINQIIADGKARNISNKYLKTGDIGDLKCSQLDKNDKTLQSIVIKNPLVKPIEFINDSLKFESKTLKLKNAPISLRLQLNAKAEQVVIAEIIDSLQHTKHLHTTKLKTK